MLQPIKSFKDTLTDDKMYDGTDSRMYTYVGQFKEIDKYVVEGSFYEYYETYLVDKTTGNIDTLWDTPVLSPDKKLLASFLGIGLDYMPNGLQVVKLNADNSVTKCLEINQDKWSAEAIQWETPNSILLKVLPITKLDNGVTRHKDSDYRYYRVIVKR